MAKYDAIISGYVSLDRVLKINTPARIGYTSIISNCDNAKMYYGGCCTNIAFLLAKLRDKPLPIIRLGSEDIKSAGLYDTFRDAGVCMAGTTIIEHETTSNCYLVLDPNRKHITLFYPGAMDRKYAGKLDADLFSESKLAILTIGAYEDNVEFFKKCHETNTPLVFGMKSDFEGFPVPLLKDILHYSEIIFTNEVEREEIENLFNLKAITELFDRGNAKIIITTLGKKGSRYYCKTPDGIETGSIGAAEVGAPVDTTGCGDAYIAGFIHAYLRGETICDCCKQGSVLSSFVIEKVGCITNAPTLSEFENRCKEIKNI
ncbi:MAG: PfkB family carbohydrate kinase [Clostridia bacterium]